MEPEGLSDLTLIADHLSDGGDHNWARAVTAARRILTARAEEIERLKGLLREAADVIEMVDAYKISLKQIDGAVAKYREAGEVTK